MSRKDVEKIIAENIEYEKKAEDLLSALPPERRGMIYSILTCRAAEEINMSKEVLLAIVSNLYDLSSAFSDGWPDLDSDDSEKIDN